ncbi:MAG: hypothetical protein AWM53_01704 [Candidatus Dichloromethanomonas elyunquensis]|nr:MAG: hypothetical protein AWM53_01704 [Candidatus Dichloromethanomonas elyunquensis]
MIIGQESLKVDNKPELRELCTEVLKRAKDPQDMYELAATLESMGWNDIMARDRFGYNDIFSMAQELWNIIQNELHITPILKTEKISTRDFLWQSIRSFLRGTIFALPMAVSVLSMLTLRFSLWSYENLSVALATSISIGTILSFVVVGGFTQALARRGFMYLGQNLGYMARKSTFYFIRFGFVTAVIVTVLFFLINWLFRIFPWSMASIIILFYFFLTTIWLSVTVMYMLKKELVFTGLITAGIGIVFILFILLKMDIIISQLIALCIVAIAGFFIARYYFYQTEKQMEKGIAPTFPRLSMMLYSTMPFFKYGFFYFLFLNLDRIIAWSTNGIYMPFVIWFRGEYELGLDFALMVLMLPMGFVEVVVNEIMMKIELDQKKYSIGEISVMNQVYRNFHNRWIRFMSIFCIINGIVLYLIIRYVDYNHIIHLRILANPITHFVLIIGIISYSVVSLGLMNSLILFSLSKPEIAGRAIAVATGVNLVVGFILSRWAAPLNAFLVARWPSLLSYLGWVNYSWAVIGLAAGSVIFFVMTRRGVARVFSYLDYYLYFTQ